MFILMGDQKTVLRKTSSGAKRIYQLKILNIPRSNGWNIIKVIKVGIYLVGNFYSQAKLVEDLTPLVIISLSNSLWQNCSNCNLWPLEEWNLPGDPTLSTLSLELTVLVRAFLCSGLKASIPTAGSWSPPDWATMLGKNKLGNVAKKHNKIVLVKKTVPVQYVSCFGLNKFLFSPKSRFLG